MIFHLFTVCVLFVLVWAVNADINSDFRRCIKSHASLNEQTRCTDAFPGPPPVAGPSGFIIDPQINNYCRQYKAEYINWAECYNSVRVNCYKPKHQDLTMSNSALRSSIEYFCQRNAYGYKFDITCEGFSDNPDLHECIRNNEITTSSGSISYEGLKHNICRYRDNSLNCIRNDNKMKTTCPDIQTTYATVYEKQLPPACDAVHNTGIWSLIIMTFLVLYCFITKYIVHRF